MIVAHLISGLELGGAETALFNLVRSLHPRVRQEVVSMTTEGVLGERIRRLGVPLRALRLGRGLQPLGALPAMVRGLREADADLVQTWMYHADLFGGLAGRLAGVPVVWGIHHTTLERGSARATTRLIAAAPWLPPITSTTGLPGEKPRADFAASRSGLGSGGGTMGLPE